MKLTALLRIALAASLVSGCARLESIPNQKTARAVSAANTAIPEGAVVVDVNGEALLKNSSEPDERVKTAAILDALRNFALQGRDEPLSTAKNDTIIAIKNWDGIEILGVTILRGGVVLIDSVTVTLVEYHDTAEKFYKWKSFNMELSLPPEDKEVGFEDLVGNLKARGIEATSGRPIGNRLWRESLAIRQWKTK